MVPSQEKNTITLLIDHILRNSLPFVVTFLFSTVLIGGSTYTLFEAPIERTRIHRETARIDRMAEEESQAKKMMEIITNGWFSNPTNRIRLNQIVNILNNSNRVGNLDSSYAVSSVKWIEQSLVQLTAERGTIKGYLFIDDLGKNVQSNIVQIYTSVIQLLERISELITTWNTIAPEMQTQRILAVTNLGIETKSAFEEQSTEVSNYLNYLTNWSRTLSQEKKDLESENASWFLRFTLAVIGVSLGSLALLGLLFGAIRLGRKPPV